MTRCGVENLKRETETLKPESRRRFLVWLGNVGLLLTAWGLAQGTLKFLKPPITQALPLPVKVGSPGDFAPNSLSFIPAATAWLGRDEGGFFALSAICPHLGCTIRQAGKIYECPCHGSRFNGQGDVLNGPATSAMVYLLVTLDDGKLVIDLTKIASPETRLSVGLNTRLAG